MTEQLEIPENMRVIAVGEAKNPASLHLSTAPVPHIAPDEVLVKISAAGVNRGDCIQRIGFYPPPAGASPVMGLEIAGTVIARGETVSNIDIGHRVAAIIAGGGYGDYINIHHSHLLPIPKNMSFTDAAALPEAMLTVYANLMEHGGLQKGETVLVHGGSSGIGTMAIQMAKHIGAHVISTVGSTEKAAFCSKLGADIVINYREQDFVEAVMQATNGQGANVILDMVGGDYIQRNIDAAARGGRIVNIAYMKGHKIALNFMPIMLKNLTLTGSTLRARPIEEKARLTELVKSKFWPLVPNTIKPIVHACFPLEKAGEAHALMESSAHIGKIILDLEA